MNKTATDPGLDLLILNEQELEIPCDESDGHPATWILTLKPRRCDCDVKTVYLFCTDCKNHLDALPPNGATDCAACGRDTMKTWSEIHTLEPLRPGDRRG